MMSVPFVSSLEIFGLEVRLFRCQIGIEGQGAEMFHMKKAEVNIYYG
jgi:hypothetical protein